MVKRPARPYKHAMQTRFTVENAKGAQPRRAGPDRGEGQEAVVAAEEDVRQHLPLGLGHLAAGHGVILPQAALLHMNHELNTQICESRLKYMRSLV
jgi:hypothetical protein